MTGRASSTRAGFTLIEVLIATLILSLGLLGLFALFPGVIQQQRNARDEALGTVAARTATSLLEGGSLFEPQALTYLRQDPYFSFRSRNHASCADERNPKNNAADRGVAYLWENDWDWTGLLPEVRNRYLDEGILTFGGGKVVLRCNPTILQRDSSSVFAASRVLPEVYVGTPQFVWDVVMRRVAPTGPDDPKGVPLQAAIFVRRIDPGIDVPREKTLSDVLTGRNLSSATQRRLPVTVDPRGLPSGDGAGRYALVLSAEVEALPSDPNLPRGLMLLKKSDGPYARENDLDMARQVGQKLVDNFGVVRTVTEVPTKYPNGVIVDPPVAVEQMQGPAYLGDTDIPANAPQNVVQVIFTPQVPVRVIVRTFE